MKVVFSLLILLFFISCNNKREEYPTDYVTQEDLKKRIFEGIPFFDFDEVVHYEISILDKDIIELSKKETLSQEDKFLRDLLYMPVPETTDEKEVFYKGLNSIHSNKYIIHSKFYVALKSIVFSEKKCNKIEFAMCGPIYRDVFIFKKEGKEIGIAKICYECGLYSFSELSSNTECFGLNNEFYELHKITEENKKLK